MDLEIMSEKENPLMGRKEIVVKMKAGEATPSRKHVLEAISSKLGNAQDCIVIDYIEQQYGAKAITIRAKVYESAELAKREPQYKAFRLTGEKKQAKVKKSKKKVAAATKAR